MAEAESTAPPRDFKKILTFAFMGLNLTVLAVGTYLVYMSTLGVEQKSLSDAQAEREIASFEEGLRGDPVLYTMAPFNTNLYGVPQRKINIEMSLEMMDEEGYEEVIGLVPQARDSIMRILNAKTFYDIESVQGKLQLKNQIVAELNSTLKKGVVKNVYFSSLVMQ